MSETIKLSIDGRAVEAPAGTLVIDAARGAGIEIPAFCYWKGLSLQAACRMCLVEVEKMPKLMTACTLPVSPGMVVRTDTAQVAAARKSMLELLLTNHPLDCPVCDKGGECELQDMVFRYGAGESRFSETKVHTPEKQFSPVVFYDAPRCILCYRCVRVCNEGMGVGALGIVNRGVVSEIAPNHGDRLECDECGMCIDICPVGALTSGAYRYRTRPWEMQHVGTVCAHCADGCTTTLGVRNGEIIRGNNRDRSGVNGEFLCLKGRYAFDFTTHEDRLREPLVRVAGELRPVSWAEAIAAVASKFRAGGRFGVVGSNHTTNEENAYLRNFARGVLGTENIDHHRTGDVAALMAVAQASTGDLYERQAVLVVGADLAREHPLLSWQIRANWRHHQARIYAVTSHPVREDKYAAASLRFDGDPFPALESLRDRLRAEPELIIVFGDVIQGAGARRLIEFGASLGIPVKYVCLVDYINSRGAADAGLMPGASGLNLARMIDEELDALWVVGANPLRGRSRRARFLVVHELFLTETARLADVVLPALSAYEKEGTVTNVCGEVQRLKPAAQFMGAKTDLEIMRLIAREMGAAVEETPRGTCFSLCAAGQVRSARNGLFASGTMGEYCQVFGALLEEDGA